MHRVNSYFILRKVCKGSAFWRGAAEEDDTTGMNEKIERRRRTTGGLESMLFVHAFFLSSFISARSKKMVAEVVKKLEIAHQHWKTSFLFMI